MSDSLAVAPLRASKFLDGMGVNTHVNYWDADSSYADFAKIRTSLDYLGIKHLRDGVPIEYTSAPRYEVLAADGYRFNFVVSASEFNKFNGYESGLKRISVFAEKLAYSIESIEGFNEVNTWTVNYGGKNSGSDLSIGHDLQTLLYNQIKASPILAQFPVLNLTVGGISVETASQLGDLKDAADFGNWHTYFAYGEQPAKNIAYGVSSAKRLSSANPVQITEVGNYTAVDSTDGSVGGVSPITQAKLNLNLLMDAAKAGVERTYLYELLDVGIEAVTTFGGSLGLFYGDGTSKPAATAIHNLRAILADEAADASSFDPEPLNFSVDGLPGHGNTLLIQKADGRYNLVIWAEPDIWDERNHTEIAVPTTSVKVNLGQLFGRIAIYDPLLGKAALSEAQNTDSITVGVTDHPVIIELWPALPDTPASADVPGQLLIGDAFANSLVGGCRDDTLTGGDGKNTLDGGDGVDLLDLSDARGAVRVDLSKTVFQTVGADQGRDLILNIENVTGGACNDVLSGSGQANLIQGGSGNDTLLDGDGNGRLDGGTGADLLFDRAGNDTYLVDYLGDEVREDESTNIDPGGVDHVIASVSFTLGSYPENLTLAGNARSGTGNDLGNCMTGNSGDNLISGLAGNDTLTGGAGNDTLLGGDGNDVLLAHPGADIIDGGSGTDTYDLSAISGCFWVYLGGSDHRGIVHANQGGVAGDHLSSTEVVRGSATHQDFLYRASGSNRLIGLGGDDQIYGKGGSDRLESGEGADTFSGGAEADDLIGGSGADWFLFDTAPEPGLIDRITDFEVRLDKVVLSRGAFGLTPGFPANTHHKATIAGSSVLYDTDDGGLWFDADGTGPGGAVQFTRLSNALAISAADILFVA